jgi:hypothetical protein
MKTSNRVIAAVCILSGILNFGFVQLLAIISQWVSMEAQDSLFLIWLVVGIPAITLLAHVIVYAIRERWLARLPRRFSGPREFPDPVERIDTPVPAVPAGGPA